MALDALGLPMVGLEADVLLKGGDRDEAGAGGKKNRLNTVLELVDNGCHCMVHSLLCIINVIVKRIVQFFECQNNIGHN